MKGTTGRRRGQLARLDEKRLPFAVQVPNAATIEAMKEMEDGSGERFDTADELFQE